LIVIHESARRPGALAQAGRDALGGEHVADLQLDGGHPGRQTEQGLGLAQRGHDPGGVDRLVAELEDAAHRHHRLDAFARAQPQLVADRDPELGRQLGADRDVVAVDLEATGDQGRRHVDDRAEPLGVDAADHDRALAVGADREAGAGDVGRHRDHAGGGLELGHQRRPLIDRAQALRPGLAQPGDGRGRRRLDQRGGLLARHAQRDVGLGPERLVDERRLEPADQGRQEHQHAHADRDRREDEHGLPARVAQVAQRDEPLERH
jgi:hypothetical protein